MPDETNLAFAALEDRAAAVSDLQPADRISLRNYRVEVEIGAFQAERNTKQGLQFNVVVEVSQAAPDGDDVDTILSYDTITEAIEFELAAERLNLLETLAERIAARILLAPQAARVFLRIEKLDRGPGALGVEIVRDAALTKTPDAGSSVRPVFAFIANGIVAQGRVAETLDKLEALREPVILCVDLPEAALMSSEEEIAQRRISLLAVEQNAWQLAGQDARCTVVDTRTELDWSIKNGQMAIWAPSKIVLDAVDVAVQSSHDALDLCLWMAEEMNASRLVLVGLDRDVRTSLPVTTLA